MKRANELSSDITFAACTATLCLHLSRDFPIVFLRFFSAGLINLSKCTSSFSGRKYEVEYMKNKCSVVLQ